MTEDIEIQQAEEARARALDPAERHRARDATILAALHAVADEVDTLLSDGDPRIRSIGAVFFEIVAPALACIGEVMRP